MNFRKTLIAFAGVASAVAMLAVVAQPAGAQSVSDLQSQIAALLQQIQQLQGQVSGGSSAGVSGFVFTRDLTVGSTGQDVQMLQKFLNSNGFVIAATGAGSPGQESTYFGALTKSALAAYQAAKGISPASGYFGPITRTNVNAAIAAGAGNNGGNQGGNSGALKGGAGSLKDADWVAGLSNEEVGEDEEDIDVAGLNIEADNSDIELSAVTINFDAVSAGSKFDKYASEVAIMFEGKEVARLDADEFDDDDDYEKTISLKSGDAIIREGDTGKLTVAISGISNLDSSDAGDTWNVGFVSVRFRDAQGAVITDSTTGDIGDSDDDTTTDSDEKEFSFENFATASDLEVKVSEGDNDINDARTISVSDTEGTDDVEILSFKIQAKGDSDVTIDDLSVDFTSVGAGVGEIINNSALVIDGDVIGTASSSIASTTDTTMTVTYDDLNLTVEAGDTVEVVVTVDINELTGGFSAGDTLAADVNPDDSAWDIEDEEGDAVGASDKTGSASSDAHSFFEEGVSVTDASSETGTSDTNGDTAGGEQGTYEIEFTVTAFGDDIYIPFGPTVTTTTVDGDDGIAYAIEDSNGDQLALNGVGLGSTTAAVSSSADTSGSYYVVNDGSSETFTLQVTFTPDADGFYRLQLHGVNFNVGSAATADTQQVANPQSDFDTNFVDIDV